MTVGLSELSESAASAYAIAAPSGTIAERRQRGAFFTPCEAAAVITAWAIRGSSDVLLEPAIGSGSFLAAASAMARRSKYRNITVRAFEIDRHSVAAAHDIAAQSYLQLDTSIQDFLQASPTPVDAAIGNPPYVRLRQLPEEQRARALAAARHELGSEMEPSGSLWMPFVLHSMKFLKEGGRLGFVLPTEVTYVRYARPLWAHLARKFERVMIYRVRERLFPEILQDVVILLADGYGGHTNHVEFSAGETLGAIVAGSAPISARIDLSELQEGRRPFTYALLNDELKELLSDPVAEATQPAREFATFRIGYVSGHKQFFHPSVSDIEQFNLPPSSLLQAVTSAKSLNSSGLFTSGLPTPKVNPLFVPNPMDLSNGEREYITFGECNGVNQRYKCKIRDPWYVVPGLHVPDLVLTVFADNPCLMLNDARYYASNSLLCGYLRYDQSNAFAVRWYTSLTLLQVELEVHSLGGGVLIMIPGEANRIRLPKRVRTTKQHLTRLHRLLSTAPSTEAYAAGDHPVLKASLGFGKREIDLIRDGVSTLRAWRNRSGE